MRYRWCCMVAVAAAATAAQAQVRLPGLPLPTLPLQTLPQTADSVDPRSLDQLSDLRRLAINSLIRANRRFLEADPNGEPIVRNEILALSPTDAAVEHAKSLGFTVDRERTIAAMDTRLIVFRTPPSTATKRALHDLSAADPGGIYDYNHIYTGGGAQSKDMPEQDSPPPTVTENPSERARIRVGLLDTGVDITHPVFHDSIIHAWGCDGTLVPAAHGTSVASLLIGRSGVFRGVRPEAELFAADVYCGKPTGGAVDTIVAALSWMVQQQVPVINVSLVGPKNATMEHVVTAMIGQGFLIVAAVGNDGPAAPPLYPAAYANVVGVTAVDSHRHVLIEAARGPQVMFAAPGADLAAATVNHAYAAVRGTSFASPVVAALLAGGLSQPHKGNADAALDDLAKQAIDLGPPGKDLTYGFGLVGENYRVDPALLIRQK
jgi:hypothetical protein